MIIGKVYLIQCGSCEGGGSMTSFTRSAQETHGLNFCPTRLLAAGSRPAVMVFWASLRLDHGLSGMGLGMGFVGLKTPWNCKPVCMCIFLGGGPELFTKLFKLPEEVLQNE